MNYLFFEHPNKRERVNLAFYFSVELTSLKKKWFITFYRNVANWEDNSAEWEFTNEDEARDTFMAIADLMRDYLYAAVLPDYAILKDYVEAINVAPSEDGWDLNLHIRIADDYDIIKFPAESEEEAMRLYKAFIVA